MTKEEKIEFLKSMSAKDLLIQYENSSEKAYHAMEWVQRREDMTLNEIMENHELVKAEVMRRITR